METRQRHLEEKNSKSEGMSKAASTLNQREKSKSRGSTPKKVKGRKALGGTPVPMVPKGKISQTAGGPRWRKMPEAHETEKTAWDPREESRPREVGGSPKQTMGTTRRKKELRSIRGGE